MRIVLLNWAHIWDGASYGGGVNGYCQTLALDLLNRGHEVISLCSGMTYTPGKSPDSIAPCALRRHPDWLGIKIFEIINSPVLAPSLLQFADPAGEIQSPRLESTFEAFLARANPDLIHFHNIEGFSAGCIRAAARLRDKTGTPRIVFSLHNYHTICPQVYLMQGHTRPCVNSAGGCNCQGCIDSVDPQQEKLDRAARFVRQFHKTHPLPKPQPVPPPPPPPLPALLPRLKEEIKRWLKGEPLVPEPAGAPPPAPVPVPIELPGVAVRSQADIASAFPADGECETRGQAGSLLRKETNGFVPKPLDISWQPLDNTIEPEPKPVAQKGIIAGSTETSLPLYGTRRSAMVDALNSCDRVLAVSDFVQRKFLSMGVQPDRIETCSIGSRITEVVRANPELVFAPEPFAENPKRPIRLVFLGYNNHYKGLHVLADALELLTPEVLRRLSVTIHAHEGQSMRWRFERLKPRLAELVYQGAYDYSDIPWLLGGKDMVIVPSVWWDNAPQTVFEAFGCGVPVLGARLGGIPDFVKDRVNGMLFTGNDRYDLARSLACIVRTPTLIDTLRKNVQPPKSITDHTQEIQSLYQGLIASVPAAQVSPKPIVTPNMPTSHIASADSAAAHLSPESSSNAQVHG